MHIPSILPIKCRFYLMDALYDLDIESAWLSHGFCRRTSYQTFNEDPSRDKGAIKRIRNQRQL